MKQWKVAALSGFFLRQTDQHSYRDSVILVINLSKFPVYVSHPVGKDLGGGVLIIVTGNGDGEFQIGVVIRIR